MSLHDHEYPWLFHRDEVDLLEDELDDLYAAFGTDPREAPMTQEAAVLQEQRQTEELADAELTLKLSMGMLHEDRHPVPPVVESPADADEEEDHVLLGIRQHPLYQSARLWAALLRGLAKAGYDRDDHDRQHFFRAYANVNLIPIKIFAALCEQMHDDPLADTVAEGEYLLALTYLQRVRQSLSSVLHTMEDFESVERLQSRGAMLEHAIEEQLMLLRRHNKRL
ncbi:hypothetical protein HZA87_04190 [Candidatus Uhrbacteria bacterium]|nr:hypothetical protein [Candidatus Uhrbacteria bacterium]